jgi:S1-C subfamily serine protease
MRTHMRCHVTVLTLCLSLAATAAFADGAAAPPTPTAPPTPAAVPNPPNVDEAALQARIDAARRRMEVAAQQLAALSAQMSAQMSGPMMQRFEAFEGPPHALIGVQLDDSSAAAGARVREVSPGGPAEQAGVRAGDLIVAVNGTNVRGQEPAGRVVELLHDVEPGDKVDLKVSRDGKTRDFTVTAGPHRDDFFIARQFPDLPPLPRVKALAPWGGGPMIIGGPVADMELARLTPGLGRYFGTDTGVLVVRAPPDGALGLQDGDVILSIGGRKPIDSSHVIRILASYDPGEKITLEVLRLHRKISVATAIPAEPAMPRGAVMIRKGVVLGPGPVITLGRDDQAF